MRYLLVGLGNIGGKRRAVLGDRCVATVDPFNPAADFRQPDQCPDERYDAAILAVPNDVKVRLMEYFLTRGKHVLVEKPLILDPATGEQLGRLARASGAIWYTSYNFRFEPNVVALKRHLDAGTIGRLYRVRMFENLNLLDGSSFLSLFPGSRRNELIGVGLPLLRSNLLYVSREAGPSGMSYRPVSSNVAGEVG